MRAGLVVSFAAHATFLAWGLFTFSSPRKLDAEPAQSIPIEIVSAQELSQLKRGERQGEKKAEALVRKRETAPEAPREAPPAPRPSPGAAAAPPPVPKGEPPAKPEPERTAAQARAEPAQEAKAETKAEVAPAPRRRPPVAGPQPKTADRTPVSRPVGESSVPDRPFDPDRIAALLDKAAAPRAATPDALAAATASIGSLQGQAERLSASEEDFLRAHIQQCWNPPVGADDPRSLVVPVRIFLNPDGSLSRPPEVVGVPENPFGQIAAEAALRAVRRCEPLPLTAGMYHKLREGFIFNFDPRDMFGG